MTDAPVRDIPVRPAASVLLLRPTPPEHRDGTGFEVFTLTRANTMAFAAGMTAFPGGAVDPSDGQPVLRWTGPDLPWWSAALGVPIAGEVVVSAVRELFEEVGVLLAAESAEVDPPASVSADARDDLAAHRLSLADLLTTQQLALRSDLLRPWARWITPPGQSRRYDTFFFVAALPAGQEIGRITGEATTGGWATPHELIRRYTEEGLGMLPPTIVVLTELAGYATVPDVLTAPRRIRPVEPEIVSRPGEPLRISINGVEIGIPAARPRD